MDIDTKLILDVASFGRHGTDPAAAVLSGLAEKHDLSDTTFLVHQFGYRTSVARLGLNGRVDYTDRNLIEKWFHTLKMSIDRFHNSWGGQSAGAFVTVLHYLNITTTASDHTNRLMIERQLTRF